MRSRATQRQVQALQGRDGCGFASSGAGSTEGLAEALFTAGEFAVSLKDAEGYLSVQQFLQVSKRPLGVDVTWSRVHEMLGDAYFRLGQYDEATSSYLAALQFNPYHPWEISVYFRIGRSYYQKRDYVRAVDAIQRMLDAAQAEGEDIRDYRVYDVLGNAEFALGNYEKAANAYLAALKIAPPNTENLEKIRTYYQYAQELNQSLG
jgi:tetratricopeptide (TPR) repeat protein